ncbi:hypothetical protein ACQW02_05650 [Humitalea sp. 24SJ18S-53]|uniref:hypothetical protein n=1 Tax=Humitalea sp. 24SJ18S-53 TaxID=3422307 RepID=UPI003D670520
MFNIARVTITLPPDMVAAVKGAMAGDDDASSREMVRDWTIKWAIRPRPAAGWPMWP